MGLSRGIDLIKERRGAPMNQPVWKIIAQVAVQVTLTFIEIWIHTKERSRGK